MARKVPEQRFDDKHCNCAAALMKYLETNYYGQKVYECHHHGCKRIVGERKTRAAAGVMTVSQERAAIQAARAAAAKERQEKRAAAEKEDPDRLRKLEDELTGGNPQ